MPVVSTGVPLTSPLLNGSSHDEPAASSRRLVWYDELPAVLQYNRYVRSGYRAGVHCCMRCAFCLQQGWRLISTRPLAGYTCGECACSILQYHNETGALQPLVGAHRLSGDGHSCMSVLAIVTQSS